MSYIEDQIQSLCRNKTPYLSQSIALLFKAHGNAAKDNANISSEVFKYSMLGSGSTISSMIGALSTLGGSHAPLTMARNTLFKYPEDHVDSLINANIKVCGFGNSFFKDKIDPSWQEFYEFACKHLNPETRRVLEIGKKIKGGSIPVNAAGLTAIFAEHFDMVDGSEILLFLLPRSISWIKSVC